MLNSSLTLIDISLDGKKIGWVGDKIMTAVDSICCRKTVERFARAANGFAGLYQIFDLSYYQILFL